MEFHAHDFLELYYFLDGSVTYYIEDQVYDLCPGDLLIIPAGKMHRPVIANEHAAYERMVLWITPQYLQSIDSPAGDLQKNLQKVGEHGYCVPFRGDETVFVTALLKKLLYMQKNDTDPKFCAGAVELYLWTIFRSYGVIDTTHRNETQVIPQVIRYITEHFSEPLTLEDIAAEFFVSKYAAFHSRQALKLDIVSTLLLIVSAVLAFTFIVPIAGAVCIAILFVVRIICFFQVCSGKAKDAAIIGKLPFLK